MNTNPTRTPPRPRLRIPTRKQFYAQQWRRAKFLKEIESINTQARKEAAR